ncbi:hypothetical protein NE865_07047 [Phthorimaea operculella]|nr:hypothetical protein NE865_07047 [Phthorimaea operculella]
MGSNTSKPGNDAAGHVQKNDLDLSLEIGANSDPRSPTPEITRTPLQGKPGAKHNITKNADLRKTFENTNGEEKLIHNNPILSAVIKNHLQSYDPRSPTQDFERTPIVIASKIDELTEEPTKLKLQNGNYGSPCLQKDDEDNYDSCAEVNESPDILAPKNLCNGFYDLSLNETEAPLGSSTASNEAIENNISQPTEENPKELLETNFDYVESEENTLSSYEENADTIGAELDCSDIKNIPLFKILNEDPRSPSVGIERTPIVVAKVPTKAIDDNVEEMSDETLIKALQSANEDFRSTVAKPKNDGVMIYEDDNQVLHDTPKKSKSDCSSGSRTPLSCVKNKSDAHMRSKSANTLEDAKGQKLLAKGRRVSHIPRLKSLSKQTKMLPTESSISLKSISKKSVMSGDCENTPPHSHRDKWDKDNSIVL